MNNLIVINSKYSTTRRVYDIKMEFPKNELKKSQKYKENFKTALFLSEQKTQKVVGGLRTLGYMKKSDLEKPIITVITIVFNGESILEETLLSAIQLNYDNIEYLIIDGGSTDGTLGIIHRYEHAVDYWISEADQGIYDAMNKGISIATGDYLIFMNCGDKFHDNDAINLDVIKALESNNYYLGRAKFCYPKKKFMLKEDDLNLPSTKTVEICHQSIIYSIDFHKILGLYSLNYQSASDYDFFMRAYNANLIANPQKKNKYVAVRGKYGNDSSQSLRHLYEMVLIDISNNVLIHTIFRRLITCLKLLGLAVLAGITTSASKPEDADRR